MLLQNQNAKVFQSTSIILLQFSLKTSVLFRVMSHSCSCVVAASISNLFLQLGILSIQRALQSTLFLADKMKIVVNVDGHVLFSTRFREIVILLKHISSTFTTILV